MRPLDTRYRGERRDGFVSVTRSWDGRCDYLTVPAAVRPPQLAEGMEWGYHGAGPSFLSWSLLFDVTGDVQLATRAYPWFRWAVVASFDRERWEITAGEVLALLDRFLVEEQAERLELVAKGGAA